MSRNTTLYTNKAGDSCLQNWTVDELRAGYDIAEQAGDDIFYLAIMAEFERRNLMVVDPPSLKFKCDQCGEAIESICEPLFCYRCQDLRTFTLSDL